MADLRSLILLRNDPEEAQKLLQVAEKGDVDAQYAAGLIFAEGRGVEQNDAFSYFWLSLACDQGDEDAKLLRTVVAVNMSQEDYDSAEQMLTNYRSGAWHPGNPASVQ